MAIIHAMRVCFGRSLSLQYMNPLLTVAVVAVVSGMGFAGRRLPLQVTHML